MRHLLMLAQRVSVEFEAIGIVDDTVEDGVGEGWFADHFVPASDRQLAVDQYGGGATVLDDLQHAAALIGIQPVRSSIVEDQELGAAKGAEQARIAAVAAFHPGLGERLGRSPD